MGKGHGVGQLSGMVITEEKARKFRLLGQKIQEEGAKQVGKPATNTKTSAPSSAPDGQVPNGGVRRKKSVNEIKIRRRNSELG